MSAELDELLLNAAKMAEAEGVDMVAFTSEPNGDGTTSATLRKNPSFAAQMVYAAARANGNFDSFMIAAIRHAREHGAGNSLFLHRELNRD